MSDPTDPVPKATPPEQTVPYWRRHLRADGTWLPGAEGGPPGEDLAALRAGLGRAAFTVPAMWSYYVSTCDGRVTPELEAEHAALALYGLHQQSRREPMHTPRVNLGQALGDLRRRENGKAQNPERTVTGRETTRDTALDRRVAAAVEATSLPPLLYRLRNLVPSLRAEAIALDYDLLMKDLSCWRYPERRQRVRRRWGLGYYAGASA
ncbi:type I-E CRISPR-associated protein Cse2/CasB [Streptomyces uncialis]|uniref:type I-E CRISPR-associated protein Cse2/CasB n=1 Tax=Streptomyces uncialis TaxID=1048205 RepID=UPI003865BB25|nr:type I-E CRISPR-associated protein Cse2/CasB [Streptomyces uncialis]